MVADLSPLFPLIRDLGIFTVAAGLIGYIARGAITSYFNKQEQDFQGEIDKEVQQFQNDLEKELQRVQNELEKEQIVFSGLHEQRAEIVSEFYAKMSEFDEDMRDMVNPFIPSGDTPREERIDEAAESGEEFRRYYREKKIYFPPHICEMVEDLLKKYRDMFQEFSVFRIHDDQDSPYEPGESSEKWVENWQSLTEDEIPELREELENHFRDLLGVDTEFDVDSDVENGLEKPDEDEEGRDTEK